jgi:hypothetical protein
MPEVPPVTRARSPLNSCIRSSSPDAGAALVQLGRRWGVPWCPAVLADGSHAIRAQRPSSARSAKCAATATLTRVEMDLALSDDLTQHVERLVSRRKSRIGSYLEQRLPQFVHRPSEVQRAP